MNKKWKNNIKLQSKDGEISIKPDRISPYKFSLSKVYYSTYTINLILSSLEKIKGYDGFTSDKEYVKFSFKLSSRENYLIKIREYLKAKRIGVSYLKELEEEYSKIKKLDIVKQREIGKKSHFYTHMLKGKIVDIYPYWLELAISILRDKHVLYYDRRNNNVYKI